MELRTVAPASMMTLRPRMESLVARSHGGVEDARADLELGGRRVVRLGLDGAVRREELGRDARVEQIHVGAEEGALVEDRGNVAAKVKGARVNAAEVAGHGLEEVEVVRGGVPVEHVEQELAVDDKAVEEHRVAEVDALAHALDAAVDDVKGRHVGVLLGGRLGEDRDVRAGGLVGLVDLVEVDVEDEVGRGEDHGVGVAALEERLVVDEVAQQEAGARAGGAERGAGEDEQAAVLAVEVPVLAGAHVVDDGAVVVRHDHTHGADAAVHEVGQGKVNETIAAEVRQRRHRAALVERAGLLGGVVAGDEADDLLHD